MTIAVVRLDRRIDCRRRRYFTEQSLSGDVFHAQHLAPTFGITPTAMITRPLRRTFTGAPSRRWHRSRYMANPLDGPVEDGFTLPSSQSRLTWLLETPRACPWP